MNTREKLEEIGLGDIMLMDGYDKCLVGIVERFGQTPIACYDKHKVYDQLKKEGMKEEYIEEWFYHNQLGAWVGDTTPCFLTLSENIF